jgi:Xaa-Pro aminopeptidase
MTHTSNEAGTAVLPPLRVDGRADRLRALLPAAGCDALLVGNLTDVRWLTGFTGSAGHLLVLADRCVLVTDGRYEEQASVELAASGAAGHVDVAIGRTAVAQSAALRQAVGAVARLGLQADHVTWARQRELAVTLPATELVPTSGLVLGLRQVKDAAEIARIERAAAIADEALGRVLPVLHEGVTEAGFAALLEHEMRVGGAEGPSFPTIVGSGPNGARPHHRAGDRTIGSGDLVVVDFGAIVDGYCSDMTRTFVLGDPTAEQAELLEVVAAAQAAGVAAVRAGVMASVVDAACRDVITAAGHGERFVHGTGHGVGLDIHEPPWISAVSTTVELVPGNVITVEPGVYRAGLGGVRIEDAVVVTHDGCRTLTTFPKDPRCLPSAPTTSRPA